MRKGFTIIELLVASLLLGMLVTILTMIFNQSSIAWRTGIKSIADLDDVRDTISAVREEADNAIAIPGAPRKVYRMVSLWDNTGQLRNRACDAEDLTKVENWEHVSEIKVSVYVNPKPKDFTPITLGRGDVGSVDTYTVNVKSAGPDRKFDTYDDVWSWPDDFD